MTTIGGGIGKRLYGKTHVIPMFESCKVQILTRLMKIKWWYNYVDNIGSARIDERGKASKNNFFRRKNKWQ